MVGQDCIMYATDFPHWDSAFPEATRPMRERTGISESLRAKVLGRNAERFFGVE
jgi:predicted TIM-barrel fold metal-dependent hydrolase